MDTDLIRAVNKLKQDVKQLKASRSPFLRHGCEYFISSQSIPNTTVTNIQYTQTTREYGDFRVPLTTDQFTVPVNGRYMINAQTGFANIGASELIMTIKLNGTAQNQEIRTPAFTHAISTFRILDVTTSDVITISIRQNSGSSQNLNTGSNETWLTIQQINS